MYKLYTFSNNIFLDYFYLKMCGTTILFSNENNIKYNNAKYINVLLLLLLLLILNNKGYH